MHRCILQIFDRRIPYRCTKQFISSRTLIADSRARLSSDFSLLVLGDYENHALADGRPAVTVTQTGSQLNSVC
eukprot:COSAG01_NODE_5110_length_4475_cov_3.906764_8_plen_73_part_00